MPPRYQYLGGIGNIPKVLGKGWLVKGDCFDLDLNANANKLLDGSYDELHNLSDASECSYGCCYDLCFF